MQLQLPSHACTFPCSLGFLVQRVQPDKADKILDTLCTRLVAGKKEADRESASISLKTTILDLPGETSKSVLRHVVPKLLQGTQTKVPEHVQLYFEGLRIQVAQSSTSQRAQIVPGCTRSA